MAARIIIGILFIVFAIVQYNDPDPWLWIILYSIVGLTSIASVFKSIPKPLYLIMILALVAATAYYIPLMMDWVSSGMPSIVGEMKASTPHIEWMREFLGLVLCLIVMVWLNRSQFKAKSDVTARPKGEMS